MHLRLSISYNLSFFLFVHIKKKKKKIIAGYIEEDIYYTDQI